MAGNLNKTKHRIASINSTKKITKAMELVSTVKLKKFKNVMLKNELYSNELKSLTCTLFSRLDDEENKYIISKCNKYTLTLNSIVQDGTWKLGEDK